jgi:UDP-2,3-diacylglucosamine hydrolase
VSLTLFISDLHLDPSRPEMIGQFLRFLNKYASQADAIYILGDFVEYWIGDDDDAHGLDTVFNALRVVAKDGLPVYFMHGNRDFLMGEKFCAKHGMRLVADPSIINLYGTPTLLMHGDTLCTDDVDYQKFRQMVRNPAWQKEFLKKSLTERRKIVTGLRETSRTETNKKADEIMDVNQASMEQVFATHGVKQLIHGHTHRPKVHESPRTRRIVLGDWYQKGNVLIYKSDGSFELRDTDFSKPL